MPAISTAVTIGNGHKNYFQGKRVLPFPEAVVTSTVKESLHSTKRSSFKFSLFYRIVTAVNTYNKLW